MAKRTSTDSEPDARTREHEDADDGWRGRAAIRAQKASVHDSKAGLVLLTRRALEERWLWRAVIAGVPAVIGASIFTDGMAGLVVGGLLIFVALAVLVMPLFSPERARRRMLASASERLPDSDGWLTVEGSVAHAGEELHAPYSERPCLAYWARRVSTDAETGRESITDGEQRAACCDFALDVDGKRVLVDTREAHLAYDRKLGDIVSFEDGKLRIEPVRDIHRGKDRNQEILLRAGDRVVVRGLFIRGASDEPYRAAVRIVAGRRRRVAIAFPIRASAEPNRPSAPR
jgi:hypothetical protein